MTRALLPADIKRLRAYQREHRLDVIGLRNAMDAPFDYTTLHQALSGRPMRQKNFQFVMDWLERFMPASHPIRSGKDAAAGNGDQEEEAPAPHPARLRSES